MNRVFVIEVLTEKALAQARAMGADTLLFNETEKDLSAEDDITLHNCSADRVRATWHTWKRNKMHVDSLKKKHPSLFIVHGYDLTLAIERAAYWNNFRRGYLDFGRREHFPGAK